ncbi:hypothetical protein C0993_001732 [Termitomyces sp. T159_Od127]|nr:hypothetical protein C0993_001732 [Termitomyces sp. T159_Od127]
MMVSSIPYDLVSIELDSADDNDSTVWQGPHLPPEILRLIFLRTIAPSFLFGSYLSAGPDSAWYKSVETALAISSVCKAWYSVGITFLYEDVVICRLDQLPKFLRTIKANSGFRYLVEKITVYTFVHSRYGASFQKYLQEILDHCSSLKDLSFRLPPYRDPRIPTLTYVEELEKIFRDPEDVPMFHFCAALPTINSTITRLSMHTPFSLALLDITCNSLVSLSLIIDPHGSMDISTHPPILFPYLEDLIITSIGYSKGRDIIGLLSVPRLQRFSFSVHGWHPYKDEDPVMMFFETYGRHLRVLHDLSDSKSEDLQTILDACPVLEHVVFVHPLVIQLSHPNVKWVDIVPDVEYPVRTNDWSLSATDWPKLERIRIISNLVFSHEPDKVFDIITTLPPDIVTSDSEAFTLDFPGIKVECTPSIIRMDRFLDYECHFEDTGTDDDADYQYDSESDCSDDVASVTYTTCPIASSVAASSDNESVASLSDLLCRRNSSESDDSE